MKRLILLLIISAFTMTLLMSSTSIVKGKDNNPHSLAARAYDITYTFSVSNKTGYDIKKLYLAPHSSAEWAEDDELLKGQAFTNGAVVNITYTTSKNAESWDMKCGWTDGSADSTWNSLNLNGATSFVMTYDKSSDTTSISRQ